MYRKIIKRILDIIFSILLLIILWPLILIIMILIKIDLGSPIFNIQERPGYKEKMFKLIKFRTMTNEKNKKGQLIDDCERVTKFGNFLRKTSLDELPEFWCILKGDMSFVGPRPLSKEYLPYYTEEEAKRHDVRPGLTGLAQINGRNNLSWEERFEYDLEYIENLSFINDVKIFLTTIKNVIIRKDVIIRGEGEVEDLDETREVQRPEYLKK